MPPPPPLSHHPGCVGSHKLISLESFWGENTELQKRKRETGEGGKTASCPRKEHFTYKM